MISDRNIAVKTALRGSSERILSYGFLMLILLLFLAIRPTEAQQSHYGGFDDLMHDQRRLLQLNGRQRDAAIRPILNRELSPGQSSDSIQETLVATRGLLPALYTWNAPLLKRKNSQVKLLPLLDLSAGAEINNFRMSGGGALGLQLTADLGRRFSLGGYGRISQYSFPRYMEQLICQQRVVPGCGYAVPSAMGGSYFWDWDVYANYEFLRFFNLEAGMGRNFWGDGYRTFFLSDEAFSYPYFKITTSFWRIKYINLYALMKDMTHTESGLWSGMENKWGSFHFLSYDVSKRVNIGFFEAIIWQNGDSAMQRGFDINYLNPLIFYRPVEFSVGSPDNSLLGVSMKVKVAKKNFFYGQFLLDDIIWGEFTGGSLNRIKHWFHAGDSSDLYGYWTNKQAWQLGFSSYDIFKLRNLDVQFEYNAARPYTFSHRRTIVNYAHYNEPLAHPAGANFSEFLGIVRYRSGRFHFRVLGLYRESGLDTAGMHAGQNIFQSTFDTWYPELSNIPVTQYGNSIGQGIKTNLLYGSLRASYLLNPALNLRAEAELAFRRLASPLATSNQCIFSLGLKMSAFTASHDR